jgi:hypothetical protein
MGALSKAMELCMAIKPSKLSSAGLDQVTGAMNLEAVRESRRPTRGQSTFMFWRISYDPQGHVREASLK